MIEVIAASRSNELGFSSTSLGASLRRLDFDNRLVPHITFSNTDGLPTVYNKRIANTSNSDILLFIHDDVWIDDCFIADRVIAGLSRFDVIGVAGNRRVPTPHVSWYFMNENGQRDDERYLSGAVAHGPTPFGPVTYYGAYPAECELLDGVLLAARRSLLHKVAVRFDESFDFHFYDLDFCRSVRRHDLRVGTWPVAITHRSGGSFGSPTWKAALGRYRKKWV